jgi:hypothetical protein
VGVGEGQSILEFGDPKDIDIGVMEKVRREESVVERMTAGPRLLATPHEAKLSHVIKWGYIQPASLIQ